MAVKHGPCLPTLKKRAQAFETKCISYLEHKTNNWVRSKISVLVGAQEPLMATVKRRKLACFGHVTRHDSLSKTILQGTFEGGPRRSRQRKCWMDNIKEWTSLLISELLTRASCRKGWKRIFAESSLMSPWRPNHNQMNRCTCITGYGYCSCVPCCTCDIFEYYKITTNKQTRNNLMFVDSVLASVTRNLRLLFPV